MLRRAGWRVGGNDPRSAVGWVARDGRRWTRLALHGARFAVAALALCAVATGTILAFWVFVAAFACLALAAPERSRSPQVADPAPLPTYSGVLEIRRGGVLLGEDRVVVAFVDGWLHVEGVETAFAFRNEDVARHLPTVGSVVLTEVTDLVRRYATRPVPTEDVPPTGRLLLKDGTELRFDVRLDAKGVLAWPDRRDWLTFGHRLGAWNREASPGGLSVLPPNRPHPSIRPRVLAELAASLAGVVLGIAVGLLWGAGWGALAFLVSPGPALFRSVLDLVRLRRVMRAA